MDSGDIPYASRVLAEQLHRDLKANRIDRVNIDTVRVAVACFLLGLKAHSGKTATDQQIEYFEKLTLRKIVEVRA